MHGFITCSLKATIPFLFVKTFTVVVAMFVGAPFIKNVEYGHSKSKNRTLTATRLLLLLLCSEKTAERQCENLSVWCLLKKIPKSN